MRFNLNFLRFTVLASFSIKRYIEAEGTYSLCSDGKHIIYLDYDNLDIRAVDLEIKNLQDDFNLGTFYIFQSSENSYHAVCLDKVRSKEYEQIIAATNCDLDFKRYNRFNRMASRVLRFSKKNGNNIKYLYSQISRGHRKKSEAHRIFLNKMFSLDIPGGFTFDDETKLFLCKYKTKIKVL